MADFKPKPGTFLPYMISAHRDEIAQRPAQVSPLTLLEILSRQARQSLPMFDLQTLSRMDASRYGDALKSLRDAGYISIDGDAPEQAIRLTDSGAGVLQLARPA